MSGITPVLATILVGDDPASETYVKMKGNACERIGMKSLKDRTYLKIPLLMNY
jgi:methylenetetrahydrofolate dehydrogenase (NADP+)/methenyltetrahydrofolate cyclohydrolase